MQGKRLNKDPLKPRFAIRHFRQDLGYWREFFFKSHGRLRPHEFSRTGLERLLKPCETMQKTAGNKRKVMKNV